VQTGLPAALAKSASDSKTASPSNRLDLARWFVSGNNSLTSRVAINRYWQTFFGTGLVKTAEDFGTQGDRPTHPELLDWLANEFQGDGRWDTKRILRHIVTSATYRQSASTNSDMLGRDPENRLLARGPRFRLTAEMLRDAALASSGLLVESLGGPSVKPYQPPGLWEELGAEAVPGPFAIYVQDHGANLYRRSLYTYQKRTVTTPSQAIFDASSRDFCRVRLPRTNTPLQALNLMNDVTYLEAARVLASSAMSEGGSTPQSRIAWVFRKALSRGPSQDELSILVRGFERRRSQFQANEESAKAVIQSGESPADTNHNSVDMAAYAATVSLIFNLDEFANR
ncbi:MAG: DUF1553 domain-containing protein, partial [Planctomycetes bacterium]|nr:DUF1553 domain-containing protein [Planctomycetota bacterium]